MWMCYTWNNNSYGRRKANGADEISGDGMNAIKTGLMGPLAGIGDTLTQGVITPIVLAVCIGLTEEEHQLQDLYYL